MGNERRLLLVVLAGAQLLCVMSSTVVAVALPDVGRSLHASSTGLQWTVDAYALVWASFLVPLGVLGDRLGHGRQFLAGLVVFAAASLADGLAPSLGALLGARAVQGLGPALLTPASLAIIAATIPAGRERAAAIGLWSAASGLGMAIGPVVGGALVDPLGWRAVFLVNVPVALVLLAAGLRVIPRVRPAVPSSRYDAGGGAWSLLAVGVLVFALIEGQDRGWGAPPIVAAFVVSAAALAALVAWELRRPDPLIDVRLFARPAFAAANAAGVILFFAFIGMTVYFSIYFQQVQHASPVEAGLRLLPLGLGFALTAPLAGRAVGRVGARLPMSAGMALAGVALLGLLSLSADSTALQLGAWFTLLGVGSGLSMTPMTFTAMAAVEPDRAGMASAILNMTRQVGVALGVAVLGAIIYAGGPSAAAYVDGMHTALVVCAIGVLAAAAAAAILVPGQR